MAKSLDELVRDTIGAQVLQILQFQAQIEAMTEELAALKAAAVKDMPEGV
jgi:uncharacterized coiled-coil protein SlyX